MTTSPHTLLRLARRTPVVLLPPPRRIGIDDWVWRKGRTYGTIIVDLEGHSVIALLRERLADVVEQ